MVEWWNIAGCFTLVSREQGCACEVVGVSDVCNVGEVEKVVVVADLDVGLASVVG